MGCLLCCRACCGWCSNWDKVGDHLRCNGETLDDFYHLCETLETGDLILFSTPTSKKTKRWSNSPWTHVAMVYRPSPENPCGPTHDPPEPKSPILIMEALGEVYRTGMCLNNPHLRLDDYMKRYPSALIAVRKLNVKRTPEMLKALEATWAKYKDVPYEKISKEKQLPVLGAACCFKPNDTSLFCSELIAYMYIGMGLLKPFEHGGKSPNRYAPSDFSTLRAFLDLQLGATLAPERVFSMHKEPYEKLPPNITAPPAAAPAPAKQQV